MQTLNKRAVIYCRVSTKEQVDNGGSLSTQERLCREYSLRNGYEVIELFIEKGESAKTDERPEFKRMMTYCTDKKNRIQTLISYKIDRICRNRDDYSSIKIALKRVGVEVKSATETLEDTPAGRFMEYMIANVAQFDNDIRTERSVTGMKDAMREGRYVWLAPLGYINAKVDGKSTIRTTHMAPIVLKAFEMVAENVYAPDAVRKIMYEQGLMGRDGKPLTKSYFYKLLRNEMYAGWIVKFGERHKGTFEPIVSELLYKQVQAVVLNRKKIIKQYLTEHPDFPLRRFIKHTSGSTLTGGWSKGRSKQYAYYRFSDGVQFQKELLERSFEVFLNKHRLEEKYHLEFKEWLRTNLMKRCTNDVKEKASIEREIAGLKSKQTMLVDKNIRGIITEEVLRSQLELIEKDLLEANITLSRISTTKFDFDKLLSYAFNLLKNPGQEWQKASFSKKIRFQWFTFPYGIAYDGTNFCTAEICRIFKLKDVFLAQKFSDVPLRNSILNRADVLSTLCCQNTIADKGKKKTINPYPMPPLENYGITTKFWNGVVNEMAHVERIQHPP